MHHDRHGLLAEVIARPDDDLPRLIYADWLDDHGDPARAELIRVQIALAPLHENEPDALPLVRRVKELLDANRDRWLAELPSLPVGLTWGHFHRGFVEELIAEEDVGLSGTHAELRGAVPLRRLTLADGSPIRRLLRSPVLSGVVEVVLTSDGISLASCALRLRELFAWPGASRIRLLCLDGVLLEAAGLAALAGAELPALTSFELNACHVSPSGAFEPLDYPRWLGQLERFALAHLPMGDFVLRTVLEMIPTGRLRRLVLRRCELTDAAAIHLSRHPLSSGLRLLDLRDNHLTMTGVRALKVGLPADTVLDVNGNG